MNNIQRIKENLQELVIKSNQEHDDEDNPNHSDGYGMYWSGFFNCLKELIPYVDSLPEEPAKRYEDEEDN